MLKIFPFLLAFPLLATNAVYVASASAGSANGTSCANAEAASYFNASGNWSPTPTGIQIGPDTTVHLCGTFTGTAGATALTFQGSGSSGHPVTVLSDSGSPANFTAPYWGSNGAINTNGNSYITIDGGGSGDPGAIPSTFSASGVIQNTANGTALANQQSSKAFYIPSGSNITVQFWDVENIYVRSGHTTEVFDDTTANCAYLGASSSVTNGTVQYNKFNFAGWCLSVVGSDNIYIAHNDIGNMEHSIIAAAAHEYIFNNHMHDWGIWDAPCPSPCAYHHDAIHCFAGGGGNTQLLAIYNNQFDGATSASVGGDGQFNQAIFMEGNGSATTCMSPGGTAYLFNNVCVLNSSSPGCILDTGNSTTGNTGDIVANNTNVGFSNSDSTLPINVQASKTATIENNASSTFGIILGGGQGGATFSAIDYNFYQDCNSFNCFDFSSTNPNVDSGSFTTWKAANCTGAGANTCDQHGGANLSSTTYLGLDSGCVAGSLSDPCKPQSGSVLIASAKNLFSVCNGQPNPGLGALCFDKAGTARPSTGPWDIGAYQFAAGASVTGSSIIGGSLVNAVIHF